MFCVYPRDDNHWQVVAIGRNYNVHEIIFTPTLQQAQDFARDLDAMVASFVEKLDILAANTRAKYENT